MEYRFSSFILHKIDGHIADIFLAEYKDALLLLDCGCRSDLKRIEQYITSTMNRPMSDLKLLIVTHFHPDHSGSAMRLSRKYNIPVAAHKNINLWYKGAGGFIQHLVDSLLAHISARSRNMPLTRVSYPRKLNVDIPFTDNSPVPGFSDWIVIEVPGHTLHDLVIYNKKESFLYCSDTIIKIRDKYLSPFPVTDRLLMQNSLKKISVLNVSKIAMAHGGIEQVNDFKKLVSNLIMELETPLNGILKIFYPLTLFSETLKKNKKL